MTLPAPFTAERKRACVSAPFTPHGEGHNKVCVCLCRWCVAEREPLPPDQLDLLAPPSLPPFQDCV